MSPRKMRVVANLVRGKSVEQALRQQHTQPKPPGRKKNKAHKNPPPNPSPGVVFWCG